jgi:TM2 domain-containing membrane protein YozV
MKSKTTAALLAFFLGGFGGHKFYLGKPVQGLLYLIFCWTFIPALIAFIEAIMLLTMNEMEFHARYNAGLPFMGLAAAPAQPQNIVVNVANTAQGGGGGDSTSKLRQLHELHQAGALTAEEYDVEKRKVLAASV